MRTAAVGDSPKIVVRSVTAERGRAEAPSSRRSSLFTVLLVLELERSELTLPDVLPPGAGVLSVPDALPLAPPGAYRHTQQSGERGFHTAPPQADWQQGRCH